MGTFDLKDNSLITLKEVSMKEVKRRNEPKLAAKAGLLPKTRGITRLRGNNMFATMILIQFTFCNFS